MINARKLAASIAIFQSWWPHKAHTGGRNNIEGWQTLKWKYQGEKDYIKKRWRCKRQPLQETHSQSFATNKLSRQFTRQVHFSHYMELWHFYNVTCTLFASYMSWLSCWDVEGMVVEQQLDETAASQRHYQKPMNKLWWQKQVFQAKTWYSWP